MKVDAEIISMFVAVVFALLGLFSYLLNGKGVAVFFGVSYIALLITVLIDIIFRIEIEPSSTDSSKLKGELKK